MGHCPGVPSPKFKVQGRSLKFDVALQIVRRRNPLNSLRVSIKSMRTGLPVWLLSAFCLLPTAFGQARGPAPTSLPSANCLPLAGLQTASVRVDVRLVNILATVRDASGQLVPALAAGDFEVREEGELQQLRVFSRESEAPLSIVLLLDASGSTAKDLKFEQESAIRFIRSILRPQDRMAFFAFTDRVVQMAPFTARAALLEQAVRAVRAYGGTSLYDAIYLAADALRNQAGRKVLILITDGGDTTSGTTFHTALRAAQQADAVIYSVVIVPIRSEAGRNIGGEHTLQLLSEGTGGRAFTPDSPEQLDPVFAAIGDELRTQYVLGYYAAPHLKAGAYRRLDVRTKNPAFTVQARKGYYLPDR